MRPGRIIRVVDVPRRRQQPEPTRIPEREPQRRPVREPARTGRMRTHPLFHDLFGYTLNCPINETRLRIK